MRNKLQHGANGQWCNGTGTTAVYEVGLGDTDDTTMYRDTEFQQYWYRPDDDTFWYRDTTNIAVLMTIFCLSRPAEK